MLKHFVKDIFQIQPLLSPQLRVACIVVFVLMFLQSLMELFFIFALTNMGVCLSDPETVRNSFLYKAIFNLSPSLETFALDTKQLLLLVGCVVVVINLIKNIFNFITAYCTTRLSEHISLTIGHEILSRYLCQNYAWHLKPEQKSLHQRMAWRDQLGTMLTHILTLYSTVLTILILFFSLVGKEPVLTTIVIATTGLSGLALFRGLRHKMDISAQEVAKNFSEENNALICLTRGIREILIYKQQKTFLDNLSKLALKGQGSRVFTNIAPPLPTWVLETVGFAMVVMALMFLIYVENADIARISAALALLVLTAWRVLPYCNRVVSLQISIRGLRPMAYSVLDLLKELRTLPMTDLPTTTGQVNFRDCIELKDICFHYSTSASYNISDVSLKITKGEKIGVIGTSGSGKTTFAGILGGLLPPTKGSISVDGVVLNENTFIDFSNQIGYVPQTPFLFEGTLAENIAFADWGKKWDEQKIMRACQAANIDFLNSDAGGILRPISENGTGLSGGQTQRVSIARALYTNPSILIFDEATSALDQHNEKSIQETIENLANQTTCVIIAHRLSTVQSCDRIIWIEGGKIIMDDKADKVIEKYLSHNKPSGE